MTDMDELVLEEIEELTVNCPECEFMDDDQYTCTTCWCQGGQGKINVLNWVLDNFYSINNSR